MTYGKVSQVKLLVEQRRQRFRLFLLYSFQTGGQSRQDESKHLRQAQDCHHRGPELFQRSCNVHT